MLLVVVFTEVLPAEAISEAEANYFGQALEQAVARQDSDFLNQKINMARFADKVLAWDMSPHRKKLMRRSLLENFQPGKILMPQLIQKEYRFLRTVRRNKTIRVLFRMVGSRGAVNYHEFLLFKNIDGVQYVDIFVYLSGENFSSTLGRLLAASGNRTEQVLMMQAFKRQNFQKYMKLFNKSSEVTRAEKTFQLMALQAAMQSGHDAEYLDLMETYRTDFPDDQSLALIAIDYYYLKHNMPALEKSILDLNEYLQGDPYLLVILAAALAENDRANDALQYLEQALQINADYPLIYMSKINIQILQKKYPDAVLTLRKFEEIFGKALTKKFCNELEARNENIKFIKSNEYKKFRPGKMKI